MNNIKIQTFVSSTECFCQLTDGIVTKNFMKYLAVAMSN